MLRLVSSRQLGISTRRTPLNLVTQPSTIVATTWSSQEHRASYWMDVIRVKVSKDGKKRHEDPEMVVQRHQEERRSDGQSLLDLESWNDRHEKKWMRPKRLESKRRYNFDKKHVSDLVKYISFVQENRDK